MDADAGHPPQEADAAVTMQPGRVLAVLTADCLPVAICDQTGTRLGLAHAGWRGLASGVLEATIDALGTNPAKLLAWLGPAIGPGAFEVGPEVRQEFLQRDAGCGDAFRPSSNRREHWMCDLYTLARRRLGTAGVRQIHGGGHCTVSAPDRFFSFRRDASLGRMATLLWRDPTMLE